MPHKWRRASQCDKDNSGWTAPKPNLFVAGLVATVIALGGSLLVGLLVIDFAKELGKLFRNLF